MIYQARDMAVVRAQLGGDSGRAGLGDAVARDRAECRGRALSRAASARSPWRRAAAGDRGRRSAPRPAAAAELALAARCARQAGGDPRRRRAGAAVPQPPRLCAAHAVPRLRPPAAMPELHRLAGRARLHAAGCNAIIAAIQSRLAAGLPGLRRRGRASPPAARASSGWRRRWPGAASRGARRR